MQESDCNRTHCFQSVPLFVPMHVFWYRSCSFSRPVVSFRKQRRDELWAVHWIWTMKFTAFYINYRCAGLVLLPHSDFCGESACSLRLGADFLQVFQLPPTALRRAGLVNLLNVVRVTVSVCCCLSLYFSLVMNWWLLCFPVGAGRSSKQEATKNSQNTRW